MNAFLSIVTLFARPLGAVINKGLSVGAGALIGYGISKGWSPTETTMIVSEVAVALSTLISGLAATQGIQIPIINQDKTNGVVVVPATNASVNQAVNSPKP